MVSSNPISRTSQITGSEKHRVEKRGVTLITARVYVIVVSIKRLFNNKPNFPENSKSCGCGFNKSGQNQNLFLISNAFRIEILDNLFFTFLFGFRIGRETILSFDVYFCSVF